MTDFKKGWHEDMSLEDTKNLAYWERNMLALLLSKVCNAHCGNDVKCGWYKHGEWEGWQRVISIDNGRITFHVPDDFDLGDLPEIEPNWNGHTTESKWEYVSALLGVKNDQ